MEVKKFHDAPCASCRQVCISYWFCFSGESCLIQKSRLAALLLSATQLHLRISHCSVILACSLLVYQVCVASSQEEEGAQGRVCPFPLRRIIRNLTRPSIYVARSGNNREWEVEMGSQADASTKTSYY